MYIHTERIGGTNSDNLIDYFVGPVSIKLSVNQEIIILKTNVLWVDDLKKVLSAAKIA
jgi:hypothetical protein